MPNALQRLVGLMLSVLTLPLIAVLVILIRVDSAGPGIHRAERIGPGARPFICFKLRTMRHDPTRGPWVTASDDPRISRMGRALRRTHVDELPQLWNVARGEMRLVGPRPEAPAFVDLKDPLHRRVFGAVPGITGLTQLLFIDEASLLGGGNSDEIYETRLLPAKIEVDAAYLERRSLRLDLWILMRTVGAIARGAVSLETVERQLGFPLPLARAALALGGHGGE